MIPPDPRHALITKLLDRIENGHKQSIGSIDNVRMVQFGIDEIAGYRAELEALAASPAPQPELEKRIEQGLALGRILGPDYDGATFEEVARELVAVKAQLAASPAPHEPPERTK